MTNTLIHEKKKLQFIPFGGSQCNANCGFLSNSPDLNAIECVFSTWDNAICKRNTQTLEELMNVAKTEWNNITLAEIRKHITRIKKAMQFASDNNGDLYESI